MPETQNLEEIDQFLEIYNSKNKKGRNKKLEPTDNQQRN